MFCYGQTRKIVYGAKDTTYYSIEHNTIDGVPYVTYRLKEPLPDGKWMTCDRKDTTQLIEEVNYKNKKKNGFSVHYSYIHQTDGLTHIYSKTEELYIDGVRINWNTTHYDSGFKIHTNFYSTVSKRKACKEKKAGYEFPILHRRDSTVRYWKDGSISEKGYLDNCDRPHGVWKKWTQDGKLFKNEFYKNGHLYKEEIFRDGNLIDTKRY